jgi:hypothetical protein
MRPTIILFAILSIVLAACSAGSEQPSASPSEAPATPVPTEAEEPTPSESESPEPDPSDGPSEAPADPPQARIPVDSVVATIVDRLTLRRGPGTHAESIGFLALDTIAYVVSGPTEVDGFPWYHVSGMGLPYASGCMTFPRDQPIGCPAFQGWIAGESQAGDPWIAPADAGSCPEPTITAISEMGFTKRLVCWGNEEITFEAFYAKLPDDAGLGGICPGIDEPAGFLYCQHLNDVGLAASAQEARFGVQRLLLSIDPASGLEMPARGQRVRVTGAFDHPAAAGCADIADSELEPAFAAFHCRTEFVPTAVVGLGN